MHRSGIIAHSRTVRSRMISINSHSGSFCRQVRWRFPEIVNELFLHSPYHPSAPDNDRFPVKTARKPPNFSGPILLVFPPGAGTNEQHTPSGRVNLCESRICQRWTEREANVLIGHPKKCAIFKIPFNGVNIFSALDLVRIKKPASLPVLQGPDILTGAHVAAGYSLAPQQPLQIDYKVITSFLSSLNSAAQVAFTVSAARLIFRHLFFMDDPEL